MKKVSKEMPETTSRQLSGGNAPMSDNKTPMVLFIILVICGMGLIEAVNSARLINEHKVVRVFPHDYVSEGVWSFFAFIRPLDVDSTDFSPTLTAIHRALNGDNNLYADFKLEGTSFIYPPTAVIELGSLGYLIRGDDFSAAFKAWDIVSRISILLTICVAAFILPGITNNRRQWILTVLIFCAFFPLRWSAMCVNIQSLITVLLAMMILFYTLGFEFAAGVIFGLAACLKPNLAPLLVFSLVRRRWRFAGAAVSTALILISASVVFLGVKPWEEYFGRLLPILASGYGYWPNHSLNGLVHRWLGHPTSITVGPESMAVDLITRIAALIFLVLSVWPRPVSAYQKKTGIGKRWDLFRAMDISIALIFVMLMSPVVWNHYYAWCVVLFAIFFAAGQEIKFSLWNFILAGLSYILLGTYVLSVKSASSGLPSIVNSTHFFGALLLSVLVWHAQVRLWREKQVISI